MMLIKGRARLQPGISLRSSGRRKRSYGRRLGLRGLRKIVRDRFERCDLRGSRKTARNLWRSAIDRAISAGASPRQVQAIKRHSDYRGDKNRIRHPVEDLISYGEEPEEDEQAPVDSRQEGGEGKKCL